MSLDVKTVIIGTSHTYNKKKIYIYIYIYIDNIKAKIMRFNRKP